MNTHERMIAVLRHQRDLLNELVMELELRSVLTVEDHAYCESRTDQVIKGLKEVRRAALDEMIKGAPWFQDSSPV
ncbi:MAG TPA: hypothetical protein PK997_03575 [Candidatus Omnitrophota bacterium]|jgi:radical SAM superfamily enzyme with C-terminal helix-hairpin-helix motif|nr:hypothetical protein [Candidatus Omnitrophota bacterium]HQB94271.1 hypothetical protein [Candidatus Omnitrophota bacterium]